MTESILEVVEIEKSYSAVRAVDRLSFHVQPGEIFALLGPNGAGKSTAVRMLMGISAPDAGEIRWRFEGRTALVGQRPPADLLGYLPEDRGLWQDVSILATMEHMGILRRMRRLDAHHEALRWLEAFDLSDRKDEKLQTLSKGNQQKIQFASSILHRPAFAALDEPFSGLDPLHQERFLELLRGLRDGGTTILLSAHQMDLVERLADRALLMSRGREVVSGDIAELKQSTGATDRLIAEFDPVPEGDELARLDEVAHVEVGPGACRILSLASGHSLGALLATLGQRYTLVSVRSEEPTLHQIFVHHVGEEAAAPLPVDSEAEEAP